ncbi:MAG: DUF1428 family protein [Beggiatoa sp.]|nr:DUF1428 family protein [Beggiatoa sp.]
MAYVDGFVLPVPKKNVQICRRMASKAGKIWREYSVICAKDLDRLMNHYATDVVVFEVKPPFQTKGADAVQFAGVCLALRIGGVAPFRPRGRPRASGIKAQPTRPAGSLSCQPLSEFFGT